MFPNDNHVIHPLPSSAGGSLRVDSGNDWRNWAAGHAGKPCGLVVVLDGADQVVGLRPSQALVGMAFRKYGMVLLKNRPFLFVSFFLFLCFFFGFLRVNRRIPGKTGKACPRLLGGFPGKSNDTNLNNQSTPSISPLNLPHQRKPI